MFQSAMRRGQDGAAADPCSTDIAALSTQNEELAITVHEGRGSPPGSGVGSPRCLPSSPLSASPAKAKMRLHPQAANTEVNKLTLLSCQAPQADSIASFPTAGQPVLDSTLKDMLMSLRSSLQADMFSFMHNFGNKMSVVEERMSCKKSNLGDIPTTVNDIIDSQDKKMEDNKWIKDKLTTLRTDHAKIILKFVA